MTDRSDDYERTVPFAKVALDQIKAFRQSAAPRNYEIWYHYATGYNPTLNRTINERLAKFGTLSTADLEQIHSDFFAPTRVGQQIDSIGGRVVGTLDQIMGVLEAAVGSTTRHSESLADASQQLGHAADGASIRRILGGLVRTVQAMEDSNRALEERLTASKEEINKLQRSLEEVRSESLTDPLTTLANRKCFDDALSRMVEHAHLRDEPLSLILTDIDHFKRFNDTYGHLTGDQVLRLVALSVKQNVKGQDLAARYGGEEFAVLLPDTTLRAATTVADYIRRAVMGKELMKRSTREILGRVTISCGVATLRAGDTMQSLIERTDTCLYAAKHAGRNRVICETDPEVSPATEMQIA
ncbi:diguanylate cyclase [Rhodoplanes serenus]|jgi:diguanylate cyclase|uniref:diguanylate cyclase n=1 Tax=Rhodoplanes serenus TaxID=200615 RepID=A0A327K8H7_9BRAD|nr:GGDEF domain-containing protein [Rhodoplanes serenus]MTW15508.1 diguanylate cyclase [Rhodoplanes serenus]RAI34561.1 GGDEF domain-containing protein [Rhodoplanes serenus]